ncbi:hypothetical protein SEA_LABELLE_99 [Mycobacterium phage Labelle]|nr:hypothetical protein SEA_LABELLE_99 [Mycobacterium phage Labelle]
MINQTDHNKEWFQITVTLGNFGSREEARQAVEEMIKRPDFIQSYIEGSWNVKGQEGQEEQELSTGTGSGF